MSWVSSGVKKVRKALKLPPITLKNVATKYAPAALAFSNPGTALMKGAGAAASIYGGGAMPQKRPVGTSTFPGYESPVGAPSGDAPYGGGFDWGSILSGAGDLFGKAGTFAKDNALDIALAGLATAQGVNSAKASKRAGELQDLAIGGAKERWATQDPLRKAGIAGMLNPERPDLSDVYVDPTNPFAKRKKVIAPMPPGRMPPAAPPFPPSRLPTSTPPLPPRVAAAKRRPIPARY